MLKTIAALASAAIIAVGSYTPVNTDSILSHTSYSLQDRYDNASVNEVFSDNILLTLAYLNGKVQKNSDVVWSAVKTPDTGKLVLEPGQTFAFHDTVLDKYKHSLTSTTNAHFISSEGFKSDGWLVGDGVCHLASFMYVAAKKAGLAVEAPTRHDFAAIPGVAREDGVSIYYSPGNPANSARQNLYITNNRSTPIAFVFSHNTDTLDITVTQYN